MIYRNGILTVLLACSSSALLITVINNSAFAGQNYSGELQQKAANRIYGKVTDIIEAAGYTYAEVDTGKEKLWAAATTTPLKIGDMISFTTEMPMKNFHSNSMNRDFPLIYFVNRFFTDSSALKESNAEIASPHGQTKAATATMAVDGIHKVEGGNTIAEVYADKEKMNGKTIRVRGKVTKFTADVMDSNWIHIRDSSTPKDLTVTTSGTAAIDAVVIIEGKLSLDKDYGYGYVYPLLVEDASITTE